MVSPFMASGVEVSLVSFQEGKVLSMPGFERIRQLDSFVSLESNVRVGSTVGLTVDIFGVVGAAILIHKDAQVLQRDVAAVRKMEVECELFEVTKV